MLEQAAESLEAYLKANIQQIFASSIAVNSLRKEWLKLNPQYQEYDLQLRVEWEDLTDEQRGCLDGCCPWVPPKAKGFFVTTRDWSNERYITRKVEERKKVKRAQIEAMKEDFAWDQ